MNLAYGNFIYPADLKAFPELIQIIPILPKENYKRNFLGEKVKDLFIFEPWKKNKSVLKYPINETIQIKYFFFIVLKKTIKKKSYFIKSF